MFGLVRNHAWLIIGPTGGVFKHGRYCRMRDLRQIGKFPARRPAIHGARNQILEKDRVHHTLLWHDRL